MGIELSGAFDMIQTIQEIRAGKLSSERLLVRILVSRNRCKPELRVLHRCTASADCFQGSENCEEKKWYFVQRFANKISEIHVILVALHGFYTLIQYTTKK